jgi:histidine ammonia-lyase
MGANSATKAFRVAENVERILAIELMNAAQAIEFRRPLKTGSELERILSEYRKKVPFIENDVEMYRHMHASLEFIRTFPLG